MAGARRWLPGRCRTSPRVDIRVIQMARDFHILPPPAAIARPQFDTSGEIVPVDRPIPELQTRETEIPPFAPSVPFDDGGEAPDLFAPTQSRAPEVLHMEPPQYPQLARAAGCEGFVVVRVTIDTEGRVAEATVVRSDVVKALEDAALEAARRWIFSPARQGGRAVAVQLEIPFSFTLD
ncbi:MAG: TonB family protein [Candidatus Eisenbacteria bacterium]